MQVGCNADSIGLSALKIMLKPIDSEFLYCRAFLQEAGGSFCGFHGKLAALENHNYALSQAALQDVRPNLTTNRGHAMEALPGMPVLVYYTSFDWSMHGNIKVSMSRIPDNRARRLTV